MMRRITKSAGRRQKNITERRRELRLERISGHLVAEPNNIRVENPVSAVPLILISTSDIDFFLLLDHVMHAEGYETLLVSEPGEIYQAVDDHKPNLILQDCKPGMSSAAETYQRLKETGPGENIPFLVLIGSDATSEHVLLLNAGVDEIITRPVSPSKLLERIGMLLGGTRDQPDDLVVTYADVEMDLKRHQVQRNGQNIHLGPIEYKLLRHLLENPGQIFTRAALIDAAWPTNVYVVQRTVDVHMGRLRKALKETSSKDLIRTVRSVGYGLAAD